MHTYTNAVRERQFRGQIGLVVHSPALIDAKSPGEHAHPGGGEIY